MSQGVLRDQDLPLRDRRQGWKHEGQGAPRGRGASCCVSRFQLILFGRLTCSTLSGAPSPWRHDPDKFPDQLPRNVGRYITMLSIFHIPFLNSSLRRKIIGPDNYSYVNAGGALTRDPGDLSE